MLSGRVQLTGKPSDVSGALEAAYLSGTLD
jgi:hypothetical protein